MNKCDSCGKLVVNEQDYMCPHCGAVANKHCDHNTHLPDERFNRTGAYNTNSNHVNTTPHKSKTYDYERVPKANESQKFDINDLANIKDAEDVKKIAKKAFIEQDANGKKKFKPLAIVLIVIFAVNIFGNLLGVAFDAVDSVFEEIESAFNEELVVGEELLIHNFSLYTCVDDATFDRENDCLTINITEMYFEYYGSHDEYYDSDTDEWQSDFSSPENYLIDADVDISLAIYDENDVQNVGFDEYSYRDSVDLAAELTDTGELKIYGLKTQLRNIAEKDVYCLLSNSNVKFENAETCEEFACSFYFPFNYIKISSDDIVSFYNIYESYENEDEMNFDEFDISEQYVPEEYVSMIEFGDTNVYSDNVFESVPAYGEYTEVVTLVD